MSWLNVKAGWLRLTKSLGRVRRRRLPLSGCSSEQTISLVLGEEHKANPKGSVVGQHRHSPNLKRARSHVLNAYRHARSWKALDLSFQSGMGNKLNNTYSHDRYRVRCCNERRARNAFCTLDSIVPLSLNWNALKQVVNPDGHGPDSDDHHADAQNPYVTSFDSDSKQKYSDAQLDE